MYFNNQKLIETERLSYYQIRNGSHIIFDLKKIYVPFWIGGENTPHQRLSGATIYPFENYLALKKSIENEEKIDINLQAIVFIQKIRENHYYELKTNDDDMVLSYYELIESQSSKYKYVLILKYFIISINLESVNYNGLYTIKLKVQPSDTLSYLKSLNCRKTVELWKRCDFSLKPKDGKKLWHDNDDDSLASQGIQENTTIYCIKLRK